jgi:hypothetical protein
MTEYWFKPKRYGYGATPTTWQGWALTLGTVAVMLAGSLYLQFTARDHLVLAITLMLAFDALALGFLTIAVRRKTEGAWRWRWGGD